jgi:hypothetical protein
MRSVVLSLASFLLGALFTVAAFRLFISQPAISAQQGFSRSIPIVPSLTSATPIVPPLPRVLLSNNVIDTNAPPGFSSGPTTYILDGMVAERIAFRNRDGIKFQYGGGAFHLTDSVFDGPLEFDFVGAAANTVMLLDSLGLLAHKPLGLPNPSALPTATQMNKARKQTIKLSKPLRGDIASQYDGSQPPQ